MRKIKSLALYLVAAALALDGIHTFQGMDYASKMASDPNARYWFLFAYSFVLVAGAIFCLVAGIQMQIKRKGDH